MAVPSAFESSPGGHRYPRVHRSYTGLYMPPHLLWRGAVGGTIDRFPRPRIVLATVAASSILAIGCGASADPSTATPSVTERSAATPVAGSDAAEPPPANGDSLPALSDFTATPGYQLLLAATDIATGRTRFPFVVIGPEGGFVENAGFSVSFFSVNEDTGSTGPPQEHSSTYRSLETELPHVHEDGSTHIHPDSQGIYVVDEVDFGSAGIWGVRATATIPEHPTGALNLQIGVRVAESTLTPAVGDLAPRTEHATTRDVTSLAEITTADPPVPALYRMTVAEALDQAKPFVVVFSTPAYCQSRVCGPVLDEVIEVMPDFQTEVEFMHVEPFDLETIRAGGGFTLNGAAVEWGLPSEPWVFIVDAEGRIASKFEGIVTAPELRDAIEAVLER